MISLDISAQGIEAIIAELEPTEKQVNAALSLTLNRMSKWVQTRTVKWLSAELQVIQKIMRRRMRKTSIRKSAAEKLENAAFSAQQRLHSLMTTWERDLRLQADTPFVSQALVAFADGYEALEDPESTLKDVYITNNSFPAGRRDELVKADTGSSYGFMHAIYHPTFNTLQDEMGYYDVFLFDPDGNLVYSVFKETDFATNMNTGPWANTGLA